VCLCGSVPCVCSVFCVMVWQRVINIVVLLRGGVAAYLIKFLCIVGGVTAYYRNGVCIECWCGSVL